MYGVNLHSMLKEIIRQGETPFEKIDCVFEFWYQENTRGTRSTDHGKNDAYLWARHCINRQNHDEQNRITRHG